MAKKKVELKIDLKPIKDQIKQAQAELRGLKPRASVAGKDKIAKTSKRLDAVIEKLALICRSRMTVPFDPSDVEE